MPDLRQGYKEPSAGGFVFLVFRVFFWLNQVIEVWTCSRFRQFLSRFALQFFLESRRRAARALRTRKTQRVHRMPVFPALASPADGSSMRMFTGRRFSTRCI